MMADASLDLPTLLRVVRPLRAMLRSLSGIAGSVRYCTDSAALCSGNHTAAYMVYNGTHLLYVDVIILDLLGQMGRIRNVHIVTTSSTLR